MARTRGAALQHVDDGELLDKEGNPVSAEVLLSGMPAPIVPAEPPKPSVPFRYRCDPSTCERDMNGWELIRILDLIMGGVALEVDAETFGKLHPDVRRHMRRFQ